MMQFVIASTILALWTIAALLPTILSGGELCAWVSFASCLKFHKVTFVLTTLIDILAVATFLAVVVAVLALSMWRSLPKYEWVGKQSAVRAWDKWTNRKDE